MYINFKRSAGILVAVVLPAVIFMAPAFLVCKRPMQRTDCIVVMLGGDFLVRKLEAMSLIEKGISEILLIPARAQVVKFDNRNPRPIEKKIIPVTARPQVNINISGWRTGIFENTHLELLMARSMMDRMGFKSAVVVSSPYHMLRLRLIARKVFANSSYDIGFQPTSFESYDSMICLKSGRYMKYVAMEYIKIAWFMLYCRFV